MTVKKFSLAAFLTVGVLAGTMNLSYGACSLRGCNKPVTPYTAKCPTCVQQEIPDCGCEQEPDPCPAISCDEPDVASCAVCPQSILPKLDKQVYTYPNDIYGRNQHIGDKPDGIMIGNGMYFEHDKLIAPSTALNNAINEGVIVGAAAPACRCDKKMPVLMDSALQGIPVDRNPANIDNSGCPTSIHTQSSMEVEHKTLVPFEISTPTGAAAPLMSSFEDVPMGYWAGCDINKLAENKVVAGYPDRTFKPALPVSRAEFATMVLKGFNLGDTMRAPQHQFKDVPTYNWANSSINAAVKEGLVAGYPDKTFKPHNPVSRAEALTVLAKSINCPMDDCKATEILGQYCDGNQVSNWAKIPVAKALQAGALSDTPKPNEIQPNKDASRADIASMLENVRVSLGYSKDDVAAADGCGYDCGCAGEKKAFVEECQVKTIPTLKLTFNDEINAKNANIGDRFSATTIDEVTINGVTFCPGSTVYGKVTQVIRPSKNQDGAIKLSFNEIKNGSLKANLPNQVLTAQVNKQKGANWFMRTLEMPFTLTGQILGNAGRTVGGALVNLGNASEEVVSGFGTGTGELFTGQFKASARSYGDVIKAIVKAPVDVTRTALSGTMGIFQITGDEVAYLVDPSGKRISQINPKEKVTIAFGCNE